jgi:hypothetical protein
MTGGATLLRKQVQPQANGQAERPESATLRAGAPFV